MLLVTRPLSGDIAETGEQCRLAVPGDLDDPHFDLCGVASWTVDGDLRNVARRNRASERHMQQFIGRLAEYQGGGGIGIKDGACQIDDEDTVGSVLDEQAKAVETDPGEAPTFEGIGHFSPVIDE